MVEVENVYLKRIESDSDEKSNNVG